MRSLTLIQRKETRSLTLLTTLLLESVRSIRKRVTLRIFSPEFTPNYGACCTFNAGLYSSGHKVALKESLRAGASYGLQFTMFINVYEKLKTNELFSTTMDGIVFIGETKKRP